LKTIDYTPSLGALHKMLAADPALMKHKLEAMYYGALPQLAQLTFVFTDDVCCPPKGSFEADPFDKVEISQTRTISKLVFDTHDEDGDFQLAGMQLLDDKDDAIANVSGHATKNRAPIEVCFKENERIISVKVGINYNDVVSLQFLLFSNP